MGIEVSQRAVDEASKNYPEITFQVGEFPALDFLLSFRPNLIITNEITRYVLDELADFLAFLR